MIALLEKNKTQLLQTLLEENTELQDIFDKAMQAADANKMIRSWVEEYLKKNKEAKLYQDFKKTGRDQFNILTWADFAAIRIMDYLDHAGETYPDPNLRMQEISTDPFGLIWNLFNHEDIDISNDLLIDMIFLFRQFSGIQERNLPEKKAVTGWMKRHPSGLDKDVVAMRERNKKRIIRKYIHMMDRGKKKDPRFKFPEGISFKEKNKMMHEWCRSRPASPRDWSSMTGVER